MSKRKDAQAQKHEDLLEQAGRTLEHEKGPDDMCFEGGNCNTFGRAQAIAGDLRTLAANDHPDDIDVKL